MHGFLSQGYFLTSNNNNLFGESTVGGSLGFTEIGVNASWVPRPDVQLAIQGLSRRAGGAAEGEPELDFGLLDYAAVETADRRLGVRRARPASLRALQRHARCGVHAPQHPVAAIHILRRTRELAISGDGILFYGEERSAWGNFMLEFLGPFFQRIDNENSEIAVFGAEFPGDLESRVSFYGAADL